MASDKAMKAMPTTEEGCTIFPTSFSHVSDLALNPIANLFGMTTTMPALARGHNQSQSACDTNTHVLITQKQLPNLSLEWAGRNEVKISPSINLAHSATS